MSKTLDIQAVLSSLSSRKNAIARLAIQLKSGIRSREEVWRAVQSEFESKTRLPVLVQRDI